MKKFLALLLCLSLTVSLFVGCGKTDDPVETGNADPSTQTPSESTSTPPATDDGGDPTEPDIWAEYTCITVAEALALCESYVDAPSTERYYIRATVDSVDNTTYGQMTVSDGTGSITVYGSKNADGTVRYDAMTEKPVAGDEVLFYGTLQYYKSNTKEIQEGWIIDWISNATDDPDNGDGNDPSGSENTDTLPADGTELTIAQILALPLASGETTTQQYIVRATVTSVTNAAYGAMTIADDTGSISVYNSKAADGTDYATMEDKPYKDDTVVLKGTVQNYNGTFEIKQAYIQDFTHAEVSVDISEYTSMTVAKAREAKADTKVQVSGVVAAITYANGMIPSGVILVDDTASIYVYDGDLAARVSVGNTVTVCASKTYWILDSEQSNASKFGYKGCNQLESATLVSNDNGSSDFDKSWIETTTVKDILETPVTTDITSLIYKVTGVVHKVDGNGFTNYYIDDLDDATGTYAYTQCNGSDFAWLDKYDGKICTVYVMALNAKSTSSDCYWRFLPVAVVDEGFDASTVNVAEHIVKYYGVGQFRSSYTGNPALELLTSVDSALLGFTGAKLSYTSSDPSVISVDDGVMNCLKTGTATITVTGSYGGKTYSEKVEISVTIAQQTQAYPTVSDAIAASVGDTVTVQGIVGPSLVNKCGFYLIDDTGVIAVETTSDVMETLAIGYEVVLEATRGFNCKDGSTYGQTCLKNATVVSNYYGSHDYSTASFCGGITVQDFYDLDINVDYTTSVFTMTAIVLVEEGSYSANIYLTDGSTKIRLYCSSASQYSWLKAYDGQDVTVEIAACNWNSKNYYVGCVLAVINADGSKVYNTLNFS